jgi:hypothetical protein
MESFEKNTKEGAPLGNWNRLKHGFYSKRLRGLDSEGAQAMSLDLEEEVSLLRAVLQKYASLATDTEDAELLGKAMELAGRTILRIGAVVRIQHALSGKGNEDRLQELVNRVLAEMGE